MTIHVLFASGRLPGERGRRLARAGGWAARAISREPVGHVAIGYDGAVLDPQIRGSKLYPFGVFVRLYPGLVLHAELPGTLPGDLESLRTGRTGFHCTPTVCRFLRLAGHTVPEMRLPGTLLRWIRDHGHQTHPVARVPRRHARGTAQDTPLDAP